MTIRSVVHVFLMKDNRVFLAQRLDAERPYYRLFDAAGGRVNEGEAHIDAALREVREETALELAPDRLHGLGVKDGCITPVTKKGSGTPYSRHFYWAKLEPHETPQQTESHKHGVWIPFARISVVFLELVPEMREFLHLVPGF